MTELTADAEQRLKAYLNGVRRSAAGTAVDPAEIVGEVRDHVESALAVLPAPITRQSLEEVLDRLGNPAHWIPEEELPSWRRVVRRLAGGPESWRLPYLTFGTTVLGVLTFPFGGFVLILVAWFLGRASIDLLEAEGGRGAAKRWLAYPPLALVGGTLAFLILTGPAFIAIAWGIGSDQYFLVLRGIDPSTLTPLQSFRLTWGFGIGCVGAWCLILSGLVAVLVRPLRWVFRPFLDSLERRHALWLAVAGAVGSLGSLLLLR